MPTGDWCDHDEVSMDGVRTILRALADVRDTEFYNLWVDLTYAWPRPSPKIEFRIYRIADTSDAYVVVGVDATRPDGTDFTWTVALTARADQLVVAGAVETHSPDDVMAEIFARSEECQDPAQAADLIRSLAREVCGYREH